MKQFRLPRKIKKKLRKTFWLYPADEKGNSLMASPYKYEKDYKAYKQGVLRDLFYESKKEQKENKRNLNKENYVLDNVLRSYVDAIFRDEYRDKYFRILLEAKNNKKALQFYFQFVNSYEQLEKDDSMSTICCLVAESAEQQLKKKYKKRFRSKKKW